MTYNRSVLMLAIAINKRKKRSLEEQKREGEVEQMISPNTHDLKYENVLWNVLMKFPTYYFR